MRIRTCATVEREGIRVVPRGQKWCRPQPVGKHTAPITAENRPNAFERHFGPFAGGVVLLWIFVRVFDFTLLPPAYNGNLLTQPFCGLHSWDLADRAWAARSHVKYGLGYTKGFRTLVVGDPPPLIPEYYVSHPPLETWVLALGMLVFGTEDWSVRLFELVFSLPCLVLILLLLRKLHGSACTLLSGLILVLLPYSAYFGFNPLMVVLGLWALHRYLLSIGRLDHGPAVRPRHLVELGIALFLIVQFNWVGIFYAFVIGVHYGWTCLARREVRWQVLAILALPSLLSLGLSFYVMFWGMRHNINLTSPSRDSVLYTSSERDTPWGLITTLYQWRARSGERRSFSWGDWQVQNLEYAQSNFTAPVLLFLGAYLLIASAQVLKRHLADPTAAGGATEANKLLHPFRHVWFYLLPGLLFLLTFKGLIWRHQYWQSPLALFVAIGSASALLSLGNVFGRIHRWLGGSVVVALILMMAVFCNHGLASYRAIRWQSPRTLDLFKELKRRIPPDRALLTFKDFVIQQNKAKVASYREEYAWYLDREMVPANAWKYDYYGAIAARIDDVVEETVREVQGQAQTGLFWYYLIPAHEEYRRDPLRQEQPVGTMLWDMDPVPPAGRERRDASFDILGAEQAGVTSLGAEELERRLRDEDWRDDRVLIWEKHRRYREAVIARLKELYHFEYYGNAANPGDENFCASGVTPCYLFDLLRPK